MIERIRVLIMEKRLQISRRKQIRYMLRMFNQNMTERGRN